MGNKVIEFKVWLCVFVQQLGQIDVKTSVTHFPLNFHQTLSYLLLSPSKFVEYHNS